MKNLTLLFLFCVTIVFCQNETKIDSLKTIVLSQSDSVKILTYSEIIKSIIAFNPSAAEEYVKFQKDLAERIGQEWAIAQSKMGEGNYFASTNKYSQAEEAYQIAKRIFEDRTDSLNLSKALNNLARPLIEQGKYEEALSNSLYALKINELINSDKSLLVGNYMAIGNIHSIMEQFDRSLEFYRKAETLAAKGESLLRLAQVRHNIGSNMMWLKRNDEAIGYFEQNLEFYESTRNDLRMAMTLTSLGANYFEMNQPIKAKPCFKRSLELAKKLGSPQGIANNARNLGRIAMNENKPNIALSYYTMGMKSSSETNSTGILVADYNNVSGAYLEMKNYKMAHHYLAKHKKLGDSLLSIENTERLNELQTKYETEKKEADIALQKEEINTLNEKAKVDKLTKGIYAGGALSGVALSGLLFFGFRQRLKKNQIAREKQEEIYKQEIVHKKKELTSQTLHLVQKNTFIQELMENFESIKNSPEKFKMEFRRIVMLLKKENASDKDWEVFKTYFAEVHNDFDQKLKTLYADISEKEIRLAAFLRMNLTTKEIAATLNVLPDSILKSKYRLKKKLNLDKDIDLTSFLNTL